LFLVVNSSKRNIGKMVKFFSLKINVIILLLVLPCFKATEYKSWTYRVSNLILKMESIQATNYDTVLCKTNKLKVLHPASFQIQTGKLHKILLCWLHEKNMFNILVVYNSLSYSKKIARRTTGAKGCQFS
jgi:hypothetical protein